MTSRSILTAGLWALVLAAPLATAACTDADTTDEFATDDVGNVDETKADLGGTYTYYTVEADARRCASPYCGGYWISLANATTTKCVDGNKADRCYVASSDWSKLHLGTGAIGVVQSAATTKKLLVRATLGKVTYGTAGTFYELRPTEAWIGQGPHAPDGPLAKVEQSGVRCIAAPCNSLHEKKLNSSATALMAEIGFDASGASQSKIDAANDALASDSIIIAGDRYTVTGPGGSAKARTATQFYVRATN